MRIFVTGSSNLTKFDKAEIRNYLKMILGGNHEIHLMCYRSLEKEILAFFIENDEYADKLHIYTFQPMDVLEESIKQAIQYLKQMGSVHTSFGIGDTLIRRSVYRKIWEEMLKNADLVICFYNGDKPSALIPVDIAEQMNIDALIYRLPAFEEEKLYLPMEMKIRLVEKKKLG